MWAREAECLRVQQAAEDKNLSFLPCTTSNFQVPLAAKIDVQGIPFPGRDARDLCLQTKATIKMTLILGGGQGRSALAWALLDWQESCGIQVVLEVKGAKRSVYLPIWRKKNHRFGHPRHGNTKAIWLRG